jgi:membrane protease YdiL (CAAX protease family)
MRQSAHTNVLDEGQQAERMTSLLLALHLIPGIVLALVFCLLAKALRGGGATVYLALITTIPLCLVPMEMGIMLVWSMKTTGIPSLRTVLGYRARAGVAEWLLIPLLLILIVLMMSLVTGPLSLRLESYLSSWVPEWLTTENTIRELSIVSSTQRRVTFLLAFVLSGLVAPIVEEMYFRGFLLPKMESMGVVAPIVNAFLFAIYHFYLPWNVPAIFLGFVPIAYAVWNRKNFLISVIVHSFINLLGVLQLAWMTQAF